MPGTMAEINYPRREWKPEMGVGLWWADRAKSYNSMPIKVQLITEMRAEGKV